MLSKVQQYVAFGFAWTLAAAGTAILIYSGQAEPYVTAAQVPGGGYGVFGGAIAVSGLGWGIVNRLKRWSWRSMAASTGLRADGRLAVLGMPDLEGDIQGRPVRVRTRTKNTGSGGQNSGEETFTVVEADLAGPADEGLILGRDPGGEAAAGYPDLGAAVVDGEFFAMGVPEAVTRDVLTPHARNSLRELGTVEGIAVGDAGGTIADAVSSSGDSWLANAAVAGAQASVAGDAATVSHETEGLLLDPAELERRLEAVVAVADGFEDATETQPS